MQDLSSLELFIEHRDSFQRIVETLKQSQSLIIETSSDLQSVLALAQIEAACLDSGIPYRRHLTKPHREGMEESTADLLILPFEEASDSITLDDKPIRLVPLMSSVTHGVSTKERPGVIDVVCSAACVAMMIAPDGERVRRLRHLLITGSWLRSSLDSGLDSMYTHLKDLLRDEGSVRVVPITEVAQPDLSVLPEVSPRMITRLAKLWQEMDFEQRSMALSEVMLPTLRSSMSSARIEELGWQRMLPAGNELDIASQLSTVEREWSDSVQDDVLFASILTDRIISSGNLV